jgi:hypothetical protein
MLPTICSGTLPILSSTALVEVHDHHITGGFSSFAVYIGPRTSALGVIVRVDGMSVNSSCVWDIPLCVMLHAPRWLRQRGTCERDI